MLNDPVNPPSKAKPGSIVRTKRKTAVPSAAHVDGLTPRQRAAVECLLQETSVARAAVAAGVNERTLRRWMQLAVFQRAYHAARRSAFGQSIGLMQRYSPLAVKTLVDVMNDARIAPAARVAAATTLLRFGREGIELDDLAVRIDSLEEAGRVPNP